MSTLVSIALGYKSLAWFNANPSFVLLEGQVVFLQQTGQFKLGDGLTALSGLAFLGGGTTYTASNGIALVGSDFQLASNDISQFNNDAAYITDSSLDTLTNKNGNISMWTNDAGYLIGNQTITFSLFGDVTGTGIGTTNISINTTVNSTFADILANGNSTGGNDIVVSTGDKFSGVNFRGYMTGEVDLNTDNGLYISPFLYLDSVSGDFYFGKDQQWLYGTGGNITLQTPGLLILQGSTTAINGAVVNNVYFSNNRGIDVVSSVGTDVLNIGTINADIINIGGAGSTINFLGTALYEYAANQYVLDKLITLNYNGATASGAGVGFEIEEGGSINGYFKTSGTRDGFLFKAPALTSVLSLDISSLSSDRTLTAPNVSGIVATLNGGQTFTNATWQGVTVAPAYGGTGVNNGTATITIAGNITHAGGAYTQTFTATGNTAVTLPTSGTLSTLAGTETLTNKRITSRVTTITSNATPTVNTDNCDAVDITALATNITSMTTNLSGTPTNFQRLTYRILDNGSARTITWGSAFIAMGVALPTTTVVSKILLVGFIYDTTTSKWGCVAVNQEA